MMKQFLYFALLLSLVKVTAQENARYQKPPKEILDLVDIEKAPSVLIDDAKEFMVFLYRDAYKSIQDLSREELRLGGLRIDPKTNIGSRITYFKTLKIKNISTKGNAILLVKGLPSAPKLANFSWSPKQQRIAFTNTTSKGVELWVMELATATATKLTTATVNANIGDVMNWFKDGKSLLLKMVSENKKPLINTKTAVPLGPTISVNEGKKAQNRTYQDLLKNPNDEHSILSN